jgi:hypothetical protein
MRGLTESMMVSTQWEETSLHAVEERERFEQAL